MPDTANSNPSTVIEDLSLEEMHGRAANVARLYRLLASELAAIGSVIRDDNYDQMGEEIPYSPRMRLREEAICALEDGNFQKTAIYWDHYSTTDENACRWEWERARKEQGKQEVTQ